MKDSREEIKKLENQVEEVKRSKEYDLAKYRKNLSSYHQKIDYINHIEMENKVNKEEIKDLKVVTLKYVMETLQLLIEKYKFNIDTLSKLLDVKKDVILSKDEKALFENCKNFDKMSDLIIMLELIGRDNADLKIGAFHQYKFF